MNLTAKELKSQLKEYINPEKAAFYPKFFKAFPGGYGEGDKFLGVTVVNQKKVIGKFTKMPMTELQKMIEDPFHEVRLSALHIAVKRYPKADQQEKHQWFQFIDQNMERLNGWDLVDTVAHKIPGPYFWEKQDTKTPLKWGKSKLLWRQRMAVVASLYFIKNHSFGLTTQLCENLLDHTHDLIHKATGWMLRESGKIDPQVLIEFLDQHAAVMPRTMLRYSLEKLEPEVRKHYMSMKDQS